MQINGVVIISWHYCIYYYTIKQLNKKQSIMKSVIIRSLRVVLVLAILCVSVNLMLFKSFWFVILVIASIFFLDASDSMLVWRLKRIENHHLKHALIYAYMIVSLIALLLFGYVQMFRSNMAPTELSTFMWIGCPPLVMAFSLRYFIIVLRVKTDFQDIDD